MKKVNHHYRDKPLKIGDIVHLDHGYHWSVELLITEWHGAWKTKCIHSNEDRTAWQGKTFTLEKQSDRVYDVQHSKLLRILHGYE